MSEAAPSPSAESGFTIGFGRAGVDIGAILDVRGGVPATLDRPLVHLADVTVNHGIVDWILLASFEAAAHCLVRLDSITVDRLKHAAIGSNGSSAGCHVLATGVVHVDGLRTPGNARPFVARISDPRSAPPGLQGKFSGTMNPGFRPD